jgi:hypothetical protein
MIYQTLEATLDPQGKIHFTEDVHLKGVHRVLITVMEPVESSEQPGQGNAASVLAFLRQNRLPDAMRLTAEQIEAQIRAERDAWD